MAAASMAAILVVSASRRLNALAAALTVTPASLALTPIQARLLTCSATLFLAISRGLARIRCVYGVMSARDGTILPSK